jgi:RNA polymerase sigma factor (sigma-70 family)
MEAILSLEIPPTRRALRGLSDEGLVRLARRGSPHAFAGIYDRYGDALYRYCLTIVREAEDARDALQATMLAAYRSLDDGSRDIALRPWLYRIAHNESVTLLRRRRLHEDIEDAALPASDSLEAYVAGRERVAELWSDLARLAPRQRQALVLHELHGLRHREVAAVLGITTPAAKQAAFEARRVLVEFAAGRDERCADIRGLLATGTRHVLYRRVVRAHLHSCPACREYADALPRRRRATGWLWPALPFAGGGAVSGSVVGGSAGVATLTTSGVGAPLAAKGLAAVVAAAALAGASGIATGDHASRQPVAPPVTATTRVTGIVPSRAVRSAAWPGRQSFAGHTGPTRPRVQRPPGDAAARPRGPETPGTSLRAGKAGSRPPEPGPQPDTASLQRADTAPPQALSAPSAVPPPGNRPNSGRPPDGG